MVPAAFCSASHGLTVWLALLACPTDGVERLHCDELFSIPWWTPLMDFFVSDRCGARKAGGSSLLAQGRMTQYLQSIPLSSFVLLSPLDGRFDQRMKVLLLQLPRPPPQVL
jgi:hypothetical protein